MNKNPEETPLGISTNMFILANWEMYVMVKEFHKTFFHPFFENEFPGGFHLIKKERMAIRAKWFADEVTEYFLAVSLSSIYPKISDLVHIYDALCDCLYFLFGNLVEGGALKFKYNRTLLPKKGYAISTALFLANNTQDFLAFTKEGIRIIIEHFFNVFKVPIDLFRIVHTANMRKLWDDGKPRFDKNGKIIKPTGWYGPEIEIEIYLEKMEHEILPISIFRNI